MGDLRELHEAFGDDALATLDPARSLARRDLPGGPAPDRVRESAARGRERLDAFAERLSEGGPSALERALHRGENLPSPRG